MASTCLLSGRAACRGERGWSAGGAGKLFERWARTWVAVSKVLECVAVVCAAACIREVTITLQVTGYAEGVKLGLTDLLDNEDSDVLPRLARRLKHLMNEISGTASKVGSAEMMNIQERLQFTTLRSLEMPCCLIVADFDGEVAVYRCDESPWLYSCELLL